MSARTPWGAPRAPWLGVGARTALTVVAISITYAAGRFVASVIVDRLRPGSPPFDMAGELAGSVLVGITLTWLSRLVEASSRRSVLVIGLVMFSSVAAVMLEGSAFAPTLSPIAGLPLGLPLQLGVSGVTAAVAVRLRSPVRSSSDSPISPAPRRSLPSNGVRLLGAACVYVGTYFVTGALNYALVTGPYYETHAGRLTTPAPATVLIVAVVEGLWLAIGTVPLARAIVGSRRSRAVACGLALYVLGGLVPLIQETSLPDVIRAASAAEILFQKVPLGVAVAWWFAATDPRPAMVGAPDARLNAHVRRSWWNPERE